ncbi:hypothetical protein HDE_12098 [Halotydeus destructor]|nr:hypothetical protein HDE_12098 [Halotydeus destructor]
MNTANDQHQTIHHNLTSNAAKQLLKGERRYPCGFPGCKWVFTRSNHVLRHHQRVHPGFKPSESPKSEAYSLPALAATISSSSFASRDAVNHSATAFSNGGSGLVGGGGGLGSAGVSSSSSGGSGFKCDFPGCDQAFKTLTLLTRHKRYVHLMIAIQEQMSYIASSNGFHPRLSTPKPYVYENPKSVDNNASLLKRDHLASRHHSQQQLHQAFPSIHSSHLSLTNLGSGQHALQLLSCSSPESEDECDDEPMSELEPEVVLQVDESQEWVPDNGTIHLVPKTSNSVGDFQALRAGGRCCLECNS